MISGNSVAIKKIMSYFEEHEIYTRELAVSQAFHSHLMEPMISAFSKELESISWNPPAIPIVSNLTGGLLDGEIAKPQYWLDHLRQPVNFKQGMYLLNELGCNTYLEIGPREVLVKLGKECSPDPANIWISTLQKDIPDDEGIMEALGQLYQRGLDVNWKELYSEYCGQKIQLPKYPFLKQEYWVEKKQQESDANITDPFLGNRLLLPGSSEIRFQNTISSKSPIYLQDHKLFDHFVVPGSSHVAMLVTSARQIISKQSCTLTDVIFSSPLKLPTVPTTTQLIFNLRDKAYDFQLVSLGSLETGDYEDHWTTHVSGSLSKLQKEEKPPKFLIDEFQKKAQFQISGEEFYETIWANQKGTGSQLRWIHTIWQGQGQALCKTSVPKLFDDITLFRLHPGLIEASFQVLHCCRTFETEKQLTIENYTYVPFSIADIHFFRESDQTDLWCYASLSAEDTNQEDNIVGDLKLISNSGEIVAEIIGFRLRRLKAQALQSSSNDLSGLLYELQWEKIPIPAPVVRQENEHWLIFADNTGVAQEMQNKLQAQSISCTLVHGTSIKNEEVISFFETSKNTFRNVVFMSTLDQVEQRKEANENVKFPSYHCLILDLVKFMLSFSGNKHQNLWLVTCDVIDNPEINTLEQSAIWGMGRVLAREQTSINTYLVDLHKADTQEHADILSVLLQAANPESQMAYHQGALWGSRLNLTKLDVDSKSLKLKGFGFYIISGGRSTQSELLAHWLFECGARMVVITDCVDQEARYLETTIGENATCVYSNLSTTEMPQVRELMDYLHQDDHGIEGVFILPRSMDDGIVDTMEVERLDKAFTQNTKGAWNLHQATLNDKIEYFVCFSSNAAILGTPGQVNYATSNAFLDQLVHYRRKLGLVGATINWGPWADLGAASKLSKIGQKHMTTQGWEPLKTDRGFSALGSILQSGISQVAVLPVNWEILTNKIPGYVKPFYGKLIDETEKEGFLDPDDIKKHLHHKSSVERMELLSIYLRQSAARISGYPIKRFQDSGTLLEYGFDSLMVVMLNNRIKSELNVSIPMRFLLGDSTINELVLKLLEVWELKIRQKL